MDPAHPEKTEKIFFLFSQLTRELIVISMDLNKNPLHLIVTSSFFCMPMNEGKIWHIPKKMETGFTKQNYTNAPTNLKVGEIAMASFSSSFRRNTASEIIAFLIFAN